MSQNKTKSLSPISTPGRRFIDYISNPTLNPTPLKCQTKHLKHPSPNAGTRSTTSFDRWSNRKCGIRLGALRRRPFLKSPPLRRERNRPGGKDFKDCKNISGR